MIRYWPAALLALALVGCETLDVTTSGRVVMREGDATGWTCASATATAR